MGCNPAPFEEEEDVSTVSIVPSHAVRNRPVLRSYQAEAVEWLDGRRGALLDVPMRGGKSAIAVHTMERRGVRRALVLCPKSVLSVWPAEFQIHGAEVWEVIAPNRGTSKLKALEIKERLAEHDGTAGPCALLLNYETAWREDVAKVLVRAGWDALVCDESHRLKAAGGKASRFVQRLSQCGGPDGLPIPLRLGLTGTPLPHSPLDIYAQARFLAPEVFGTSYTLFKARYAVPNPYIPQQVVGFQNLDELASKMGRFTFRVEADALRIPEPQHLERTFDLGAKAQRAYDGLERELLADIDEGRITAANAMVRLLRLRQVTGGHAKLEDGATIEIDTGRAELLADLLEDMPRTDMPRRYREPLVVCCVFRPELAKVREVCEAAGWKTGELSGERNDLEAFQSGRVDAIAVQIQAGGVGINLSRARYSVLWSVGFSLGDLEQFLARTKLVGQTEPRTFIHLIAEGTVDRAVYGALRKRKEIVSEVLMEMRRTRP